MSDAAGDFPTRYVASPNALATARTPASTSSVPRSRVQSSGDGVVQVHGDGRRAVGDQQARRDSRRVREIFGVCLRAVSQTKQHRVHQAPPAFERRDAGFAAVSLEAIHEQSGDAAE